jgi:hypothetical protein
MSRQPLGGSHQLGLRAGLPETTAAYLHQHRWPADQRAASAVAGAAAAVPGRGAGGSAALHHGLHLQPGHRPARAGPDLSQRLQVEEEQLVEI